MLNKAEYIISTHVLTYIPQEINKLVTKNLIKYKSKIIFLQHGIIKDYLPQLFYPNIKPDIFICGAKPEYEYILKEFKHPNGVINYTGLARFDNLHDLNIKKQILVMPTWRSYLANLTEKEFERSEYFNVFNNFIKNEKLIKALKESNYNLVFYPHYEIQKFIHLFKSIDSSIKIGSIKEYDVQTLLKESSLLITDYSSVFFDFAYMNKPIIYYQFDKEEFFEKHYQRGYFDYEKIGFGDVIYSQNDLINSIKIAIDENCIVREKYISRIEKFFPINDNKNCERILEKILEL